MRTIKVWGIEYTIKINGKWCKNWTGPCGIYTMSFQDKLGDTILGFVGQPIFFRIKKLAEAEIEKRGRKNWIKYRVVHFELKWRKIK